MTREFFPIATRNAFPHHADMVEDPFIIGLRAFFDANPQVKPATVSAAVGLDKSTLRKMLSGGVQTPKRENADKISAALGLTVDDIIALASGDGSVAHRDVIAVAGDAGAGAQVDLVDAYAKGNGKFLVVRPQQLVGKHVVAVEVKGSSMMPTYLPDGILFYTRDVIGVPTEAEFRICVTEDQDGKIWVKQIKPGSEPGLHHLVSINPNVAPMYDCKLKWAAPVIFYLPPEFVKKVD